MGRLPAVDRVRFGTAAPGQHRAELDGRHRTGVLPGYAAAAVEPEHGRHPPFQAAGAAAAVLEVHLAQCLGGDLLKFLVAGIGPLNVEGGGGALGPPANRTITAAPASGRALPPHHLDGGSRGGPCAEGAPSPGHEASRELSSARVGGATEAWCRRFLYPW